MEVKLWTKRKLKRYLKNHRIYNKKIRLLLVIILFFVVIFSVYNYIALPQIHLKGKKTVYLNYKEPYKEKGYTATFLGKNISKEVKIKGKVNSNKLGTYQIIYKAKKGYLKNKVIRKVIVRDSEKPKLKISKEDVYICPGSEIVPEKVEAIDNYDGNLTDKVKNIISKDKTTITYSVIDKSGNKREITKKIIEKDIEKPVITLNGTEYIYLYLDDEYKEPGVTVKDNCDSKLEKNVKIEGSVDTKNVGEYTITYIVKDTAENEEKLTRKVIVSERSKNGTIYLTFDDGPNSGTTNVILDILKEEDVKATFFVTNKGPDELIKREFDEGHTVALHTASHDYSVLYASDEAYFNDLYSVQDRVKRITGEESKIIRFPGGSSNTISRRYSEGIMSRLTKEVQNRGFKYYDWNLSSGDAAGGSPTSDTIYNNVVNSLSHDRVNMVLMHDIKTYTRDALKRIIQYGKENGYHFEKITMDTEMITQRVNN